MTSEGRTFMDKEIDSILYIPELRVINANCISGPVTWGFPAITAFAGFVHSISRKLNDVDLDGVGVVCHEFDPLVYKGSRGYEYRFSLTRNPVYDRDPAKRSGIVEEGRVHLKISLIIGITGYVEDREELLKEIMGYVGGMRIAGGSILPEDSSIKPEIIELRGNAEDDREIFRRIRRKVLPGFALVDRTDFLHEHLQLMREKDSSLNALDALMDISAVKHEPESAEEHTEWKSYKEGEGWLVPIPVGFNRISKLFSPGEVAKTRDRETPFCFVETAYSLGEWINPLKLTNFDDLLWFYDANPEEGEYICAHKKLY
jgi:CRISPR-associated protein Csy2